MIFVVFVRVSLRSSVPVFVHLVCGSLPLATFDKAPQFPAFLSKLFIGSDEL